jgi:hypothetical protein
MDAAYDSVLLASGGGEKSISPNRSAVDGNEFLAKSAYLFLLAYREPKSSDVFTGPTYVIEYRQPRAI